MTEAKNSLISDAIVSSEYYGQRVDVVLAQLFPEYSRSQLTQWLKNGAITLNNRSYKPKDKLQGGEVVHMHVNLITPFKPNLPEAIPIEIVFEDNSILIINKPYGLVVHPGAGNPDHTLVNALIHHKPELNHLPRAGIVHRLDKDTTGLLIVAKKLTSHTSLIRQMQAREIQRHYITLVHGQIISGGTIDTFYGRHPRNRLKMAVCTQGRLAITHYSVRKHYTGLTLLDVKLMTGRTHQIRVHLSHINHPIVGDQLYCGRNRIPGGIPDEQRTALQQFKRQALHAGFISFLHPETQQPLTFNAPLPDDFQTLLTILDKSIDSSDCELAGTSSY